MRDGPGVGWPLPGQQRKPELWAEKLQRKKKA